MTDDDGTGNGTILNNAWLQSVYDSIEEPMRKAEEPQGMVAVAVGVGLALAGSPRRLTRRGFLGLRG